MNLEYKIVLTVLGQRCNTYIFEDMQLIEEKYSDTDLALVNIGNEKRSGRAIAHSDPLALATRFFLGSHGRTKLRNDDGLIDRCKPIAKEANGRSVPLTQYQIILYEKHR